jgi:hypothetical protein
LSSNNLIGVLVGLGGVGGGLNNSNQVGVADPKLGPLANNGGPTKTHALLMSSQAIDKGNNAEAPPSLTTDQRGLGFVRVFKNVVDIGAFETQIVFPWHNFAKPLDVRGGISVTPDNSVDAGDALAIINYINAFDPLDVPANAEEGLPFGFLDVVKDNVIAPEDALTIINAINAGLGGEGEAEASAEGAVRSAGLDVNGQVAGDEAWMALLAEDVLAVVGHWRRGARRG